MKRPPAGGSGKGFDELMRHFPNPASAEELFDDVGSCIDQDMAHCRQVLERVRASVEEHRRAAFYRTVERPAEGAAALKRKPNEILQAKFSC